MSTTMSQKSSGSKGKQRGTITRRSWSINEEKALIEALKDIVAKGWKCDNGFKTGYLQILHQRMVEKFPGTDLKADPHIVSRIHVWKKNYGSISTMLTRSGFGWNQTSNTIDVADDQVWDEYVKSDSNARLMRYKPWPFYNDWLVIFGKDRATGENAEALIEAVNDITKQDKVSNEASAGADYVPFVNATTNDEDSEQMSSMNNEGTSSGHPKKGKKKLHKRPRMNDDIEDRIIDMMAEMTKYFGETKKCLSELAQRIGFEHDTSTTRKNVLEALSPMPNLSIEDKINVAKVVCNSPQELDIFFGLKDDGKATMVKMILEGRC